VGGIADTWHAFYHAVYIGARLVRSFLSDRSSSRSCLPLALGEMDYF